MNNLKVKDQDQLDPKVTLSSAEKFASAQAFGKEGKRSFHCKW